ncbi:uncharacterized protein LOC117641271 [Thrips palmi]|uniref:Uncharacterized protein LOC117641271 n=1 Tax=Thrips palmi TaxID=161013 RepID=A0A6P8Y468_THRPL|nr:uncharacterized protein LOC117641271 [Thrips palmi]
MRAVLAFATILAAAAASPALQPEPPVHARTCSRSNKDNTLNNCIRHNIQAFIPHVKNGGKFGLPSLEPFHVPETSFDLRTGLIDFHAVMRNLTVYGLGDAVVRDAMADLGDDAMLMDVGLLLPKVSFRGMLELSGGQILELPFKGRGIFDFTFSDINATWRVVGKRQAGEEHLEVQSVTPTYTVGGMTTDIKLPDQGIPNLDRVINAVMNHYWTIMVDMGKAYVQKPISHQLRSVINTLFQNVPYDQMFPASWLAALLAGDINATWRVVGKRQAGEEHLEVQSVTPTYTVGGMTTDIKLPDQGIPNLDRVINAVMNHYWTIMVDMGKAYVQKPISHQLRSVINTLFQNVPYDQMFPA